MLEDYRVRAEIDLSKIKNNIKEVRNKIGNSVKLMAIVKADAYGHGAVQVAKCLESDVDAFGVAIIEEGIELRNAGVVKRVLLLGYTSPERYDEILLYNLVPTIFTYEAAKKLSEKAAKKQKTAYVNIAVDTGMNRIGFSDTVESVKVIKQISKLPYIKISGLFTHYAKADFADKSDMIIQKQRYDEFVCLLEKEQIYIPCKHAANSAAIMEGYNCTYDMVRSGIITYGLYPSKEVDRHELIVNPAMSVKSHISFVKKIKKGSSVGYGGTFTARKDMLIATVPVGYADGYPCKLANIGSVLVHGKKVQITGRICMDQFMIDVTDIENVKTGDEVVLMGAQKNEFIGAEEIADLVGTISYEIVCGISKRVPRYYI